MAEKLHKTKTSERVLRFGRDINVLGAVAVGGLAVVVPGPNVLLASWAALNAAQAAGFEFWRQSVKEK